LQFLFHVSVAVDQHAATRGFIFVCMLNSFHEFAVTKANHDAVARLARGRRKFFHNERPFTLPFLRSHVLRIVVFFELKVVLALALPDPATAFGLLVAPDYFRVLLLFLKEVEHQLIVCDILTRCIRLTPHLQSN
jgi:hypothetical protein